MRKLKIAVACFVLGFAATAQANMWCNQSVGGGYCDVPWYDFYFGFWTAMPATDVSLFPSDQYYTVYSCLVSNNPFVIIQVDYYDPEWNRYYEFDVVSCMYT